MPLDVVAGLLAGNDDAWFENGACADGVVALLVDQDEGARVPIVVVGVGDHHGTGSERDRSDIVESQFDRAVLLVERFRIETGVQFLDGRSHGPGRVFERYPIARAQRCVGQPADRGFEFSGQNRQMSLRTAADQNVATSDVDVVGQFHRNRQWCNGSTAVVVESVQTDHGALRSGRQDHYLVSDAQCACRNPAGVPATILRIGARNPLHGKPKLLDVRRGRMEFDAFEVLEERRPLVPRGVLGPRHDIVAGFRGDRYGEYVLASDLPCQGPQFFLHLSESRFVEVHQIDLVHHGYKVRNTEQCGDSGVPTGLTQHAGPRVDQQDRYVSVGCSGEHVARVAFVPRGVGEYVTSGRGGEESVRDVDRDALFTLGT